MNQETKNRLLKLLDKITKNYIKSKNIEKSNKYYDDIYYKENYNNQEDDDIEYNNDGYQIRSFEDCD